MNVLKDLSVAFVYKHKMTSEVLVVDIERARELDAARPYWAIERGICHDFSLHTS